MRKVTTAEIMGQTFSALTVIGPAPHKENRPAVLCRCVCGAETAVVRKELISGHNTSCGCQRVERMRQMGLRNRRHGESKGRVYNIWVGMRKRCESPDQDSYPQYGGRGISVCDRWQRFENFQADMGPRPPHTSIDRINNDGNYEPGNCRWATRVQQQNNKSDNRRLTHDGTTMTTAEWAHLIGIAPRTFRARLRRGWSLSEALSPQMQDVKLDRVAKEKMVEMRSAGLSQDEIAKALGVTHGAISMALTALEVERFRSSAKVRARGHVV